MRYSICGERFRGSMEDNVWVWLSPGWEDRLQLLQDRWSRVEERLCGRVSVCANHVAAASSRKNKEQGKHGYVDIVLRRFLCQMAGQVQTCNFPIVVCEIGAPIYQPLHSSAFLGYVRTNVGAGLLCSAPPLLVRGWCDSGFLSLLFAVKIQTQLFEAVFGSITNVEVFVVLGNFG